MQLLSNAKKEQVKLPPVICDPLGVKETFLELAKKKYAAQLRGLKELFKPEEEMK